MRRCGISRVVIHHQSHAHFARKFGSDRRFGAGVHHTDTGTSQRERDLRSTRPLRPVVAVSLFWPLLPSSVLALGTTVHLALSALRHHRRPGPAPFSPLTLISIALSLTPWAFPSAVGLAVGLALHGLWFMVCERLAPPRPDPIAAVPATTERRTGVERRASVERRTPDTTRSGGFVQAPVLAVFDETADIKTFRLARPEGFDFVAGQFLPIRVRIDGREHVRCYSLSSAPSAPGYMEISVKRQGLVSGALHTIATQGALVSVRSPGGSFLYPAADDRPLVLIAGGIGITPMLSMLRHAVEAEPSRKVTLLYAAATEEAFAFHQDIQAIVSRHPQASAHFAVTKGRTGPAFYPGRIDATLVRTAAPHIANSIAMICGPQPMINATRELLISLGMAAADVRSELFEAAVAASAGHVPQSPRRRATAAARHDVTCSRSQAAVKAMAGQTLLEAAEAGGIAIDSLCRSGVCGTCRTRVIKGDVSCESTLLDDADRATGYVLACVSHVESDCVVEL